MKGKRPKWDMFINKFGTHYSHAITSGYLELLETHYSSNAEYVSRNTKFSLTDSAKATLENLIEAGGKIGVDFQWGEKLSGTVGQRMSDTSAWAVRTPQWRSSSISGRRRSC